MIYIVDTPSLAAFQAAKAKTGFDSNNLYLIKPEGRFWTKGMFLGPKVSLTGSAEEQASGKVSIQNAVWNGDKIAVTKGGTGLTSFAKGDLIYASDANVLSTLAKGSDGQVLTINSSGLPVWTNASSISAGTASKVANKFTITLVSGSGSSAVTTSYEFDGSAAKAFKLVAGSNVSISKGTGDNANTFTIAASIGVSSIKVATTGLTDLSSAKTGAIVLGDAASKVVASSVASGGTGLPTAGAVYTFVTTQIADGLKVANITTPATANDYLTGVTKDDTNKTLAFTSGSFVGLTVSYGTLTSKTGLTYKPNDAAGSTIYIPTALSHLTGMGTMVGGNIVVGDGTTGIKNSGYSIRTSDVGSVGSTDKSLPTSYAVKQYVDNKITSSMYFRGAIAVTSNSLTFPSGTTGYNVGDAWRVGSVASGSTVVIGGKKLEVGDLIIATTARSAIANANLADFTVVQNNVDVFGGADANNAGTIGLVPAPAKGAQTYILLGSGAWTAPSNITVGGSTYATRLGNSSNYFTYGSLSNYLGWATMSSTGVITAADGSTTLLS